MPLLLYACASQPVSVEMPVPRGRSVVSPGRAGFVIAAPHGTADRPTGDFAAELARRTGFALFVGGDAALPYERRVLEAAHGRLVFYAEIHATNRRESANRIDIATAGIEPDLALRLRTLFELIRDAHLRGHPGTPRIEAVIEPAGKAFAATSAGEREGLPRMPARALQLDLPRAARGDAREIYLAILAEFLAQSATLPAGR